MNVLVLGGRGNMGRRYVSILKHLGCEAIAIDFPHTLKELRMALQMVERVIIATPTEIHLESLQQIYLNAPNNLKVLCEKPLSKDRKELDRAFWMQNVNLFVVNQYAYLPEAHSFLNKGKGEAWGHPTKYSYFNSGRDGLMWDCWQLFGLASDIVQLSNDSPIWQCRINDIPVSISGMDRAYIDMVQDFIGKGERLWGEEMVRKTTERVFKYVAEGK